MLICAGYSALWGRFGLISHKLILKHCLVTCSLNTFQNKYRFLLTVFPSYIFVTVLTQRECWRGGLSWVLYAVMSVVWQVTLGFPQAELQLSRRNDLATQVSSLGWMKILQQPRFVSWVPGRCVRELSKNCIIILIDRTYDMYDRRFKNLGDNRWRWIKYIT